MEEDDPSSRARAIIYGALEWDLADDDTREAFRAFAGGQSMRQASLGAGFNKHHLSQVKHRHPDRFQGLYEQAVREVGRTVGGEDAIVIEDPGERRNIFAIKQLVGLYVRGKSMRQASIDLGFGESYLALWRRTHQSEFLELYAQAVEEAQQEAADNPSLVIYKDPDEPRHKNIDKISRAIAMHAQGITMRQASLEAGFNEGWLGIFRHSFPGKFQELYWQAVGQEQQNPTVKLASRLYVSGEAISQIDSIVGAPAGWFEGWLEDNPVYSQALSRSRKGISLLVDEALTVVDDPNHNLEETDTIEQALQMIVRGAPMATAGLVFGYSVSWLAAWKRNHPEEFQELYDEAVAEVRQAGGEVVNETPPTIENQELLQQKVRREAINAVVGGKSMKQASLEAGHGDNWLVHWKMNHPEEFQILYDEAVAEVRQAGGEVINEAPPTRTRRAVAFSARREAIAAVVRGKSMRQASLGVGLSGNWLATWGSNNPEEFQMLYDEAVTEARQAGDEVVNETPPTRGRPPAGLALERG